MKTRSVNSPWKYFHRCLIQWNITSLTVKFSLLYLFLILKKICTYLAILGLTCGTWDLFPWPGITSRPPCIRSAHVSHWTNNVLAVQLCPTLGLHDCSPPRSSVREILQARVLEWVAISYSRGSSQLRDQTRVSCIAGRFFTIWAIREAHLDYTHTKCSSGYCMGTAEA